MLKRLAILAGVTLIGTVILVARYDKMHGAGGEGYNVKCEQYGQPPFTSGTLMCEIDHGQNTEKGKPNPPWWHEFFAWPEGITALLIMFTLGAIIWQAWETRKAAEAAGRNIEVFIASQQPQIVVIAHEDPTQDLASDTPRVQMELTNRGPTTALGLFYEWWIEIMPFPFIDFTDNADYYRSPELISVYPGQPPMVLNMPLSRGLTAAQLLELKRAEKFACIRVKATYRDGFSKKLQWVSFGYYIQADGLGFLEKYNYSGEE
jgi:hypothetical protein